MMAGGRPFWEAPLASLDAGQWEALEKLRAGMYLMIREGSAALSCALAAALSAQAGGAVQTVASVP